MNKIFKKLLAKNHARNRGSSLIELLISVVIVGSLVTATAIGMTYTLKNSAETRYRDASSALAQDGIELFRKEREVRGWDSFFGMFNDGISYRCLNGESPTIGTTSNQCTSTFVFSNNNYQRQAKITKNAGNKSLEIEVTITWNVGNSPQQTTKATQILRDRY